MNLSNRKLWVSLGLLIGLIFGGFEGIYGRSDYSQDAVCYLTVAQQLHAHEWKLAANPIWSIGYPALIWGVDSLHRGTALTEWKLVHILNLVIFCCTYFAFLFFLSAARIKSAASSQTPSSDPAFPKRDANPQPSVRTGELSLFIAASAIFLGIELNYTPISLVSPDMLVACFFFLTLGLLLRIQAQPSLRLSVLLGVTCGLGFIAKAVFLPMSVFAFLFFFILMLQRRPRAASSPAFFAGHAIPAGIAFLLLAAPYWIALSVSLGRPTTGTAGGLNYATHADEMPQIYWQGGPPRLGRPLHPVHLLLENPQVYEYAQPFHVPYPPFAERFYFVDGYRLYFSARQQTVAIRRSIHTLRLELTKHPVVYAWAFVLITLTVGFPAVRRPWLAAWLSLWPAWVLALVGMAIYIIVLILNRYIPGFLIVLLVSPLIAFLRLRIDLPRTLARTIVAVALVGLIADLAFSNLPTFRRALHGRTAPNDPSWQLGTNLSRFGVPPGSKVAVLVHDTGAYASWAYIGQVNIVAELLEPGLAHDPVTDDYEGDFRDYPPPSPNLPPNFWQLAPTRQQQVLDLFRNAGAVAVVSLSKPKEIPAPPGWTPVADSGSWLYRF